MTFRRAALVLPLALACGHRAPPGSLGAEGASALLARACERALARLAPDAAGEPPAPLELPAEIAPAVRALRGTGMGARVDAFESAVERAARLVLAAVGPRLEAAAAGFSPRDAEVPSNGPDAALSRAFLEAHSGELRVQLRAESVHALDEAGVAAALAPLRDGARRLPLPREIDPDLAALVSERALQEFSLELAEQERRIRKESGSESGGYGPATNSGPPTSNN